MLAAYNLVRTLVRLPTRSSLRYRVLSLVALLVLALSITSFVGLRSVETFEMRGRSVGFPQPIFGAEMLRMGVNVALEQYDSATLDARLGDISTHGIQYVRQEFRWNDIEPTRGRFDWVSSDRIFSATAKYGLSVLPVLWTTPAWARTQSASEASPATETAPPADMAEFAQFVKAFAERYDDERPTADHGVYRRSSIVGFQIWDEPNLSSAWGNALINPTGYLQLLRAAREAIHSVAPDARIVLAALAPTSEESNVNLAPQTFLLKLYQLGGHESFDIAAAKPYGFAAPPEDRRVDPSALNFSHIVLMREVMVMHGDGNKAIWATSFGWNTLPAYWQGEKSMWSGVAETTQAQDTTQAVRRAAREWPWLGALFIENLQPRPRTKEPRADPHWGFALLAQDGTRRPVYAAFASAVKEAALAPRAQLFAACQSPQSLVRTLRLDNVQTAMPEVLASKPDCRTPNSLAQFTDGWRFDQLGADIPDRPNAKVTLRFNGDALALIVRRGPYRAYTFVSIDGQPANALPREGRGAYLVMNSAGQYPLIETIPVARGLESGEHVAEITVDRGWNQWALIGWSSIFDYRFSILDWGTMRMVAVIIGALALIGLVGCTPHAQWREGIASFISRVRSVPFDPAKLTPSALVAALIYWLAAGLTWAQDAATAYQNLGLSPNVVIPSVAAAVAFWSSVMVISLIALAILFVLVLMRLDVGLALLAFFIPFYLQPQRLFERAFSMVELLTILCVTRFLIFDFGVWIARDGLKSKIANLKSNLSLFDVSVLALVIVSVLSASQAQFPVEAFREWRTVIVEPALVYLMLRTLSPSPKAHGVGVRGVLSGYLLGALAVALIGLANYARGITFSAEFGLPRLMGVFNSANNDALYLERAVAITFAFTVFGRWTMDDGRQTMVVRPSWPAVLNQLAYPLALIPLALDLLLTQSRGALLFGVPIALVVMMLVAGKRWRAVGLAVLAVGIMTIALISSGTLTPLLEGTRFARIASTFDLTSGSSFVRVNLWQSALAMWRDHQLLGVGPDNFLYAYRSFYILPAAWQEPNLSHPHNIVLDFATRLGALGVVVGMGLVIGYGLLAKQTLKINRALAIGCGGFLAAMLAHGMVDHSLFLIELAFPFMLTAGAMAAQQTAQAVFQSRP